jgi:hypothetical protein
MQKSPSTLDGLFCISGWEFGGPAGIRTPDLLNAIEARSQLRHRPTREGWSTVTSLS